MEGMIREDHFLFFVCKKLEGMVKTILIHNFVTF